MLREGRAASERRAPASQGFVNVFSSAEARYDALPANATFTFHVFWPAGRSGSGMSAASLLMWPGLYGWPFTVTSTGTGGFTTAFPSLIRVRRNVYVPDGVPTSPLYVPHEKFSTFMTVLHLKI